MNYIIRNSNRIIIPKVCISNTPKITGVFDDFNKIDNIQGKIGYVRDKTRDKIVDETMKELCIIKEKVKDDPDIKEINIQYSIGAISVSMTAEVNRVQEKKDMDYYE